MNMAEYGSKPCMTVEASHHALKWTGGKEAPITKDSFPPAKGGPAPKPSGV